MLIQPLFTSSSYTDRSKRVCKKTILHALWYENYPYIRETHFEANVDHNVQEKNIETKTVFFLFNY